MSSALVVLRASACGIFKHSETDLNDLCKDLQIAFQSLGVVGETALSLSFHAATDTIQCFLPNQFESVRAICSERDNSLLLQLESFCVRALVFNVDRLVYGQCSRERVPFVGDVGVPTFDTTPLREHGGATVVGSASLELVCGSVLMHIRDADNDEHARRIADWVLDSSVATRAAEVALGPRVGRLTFLAHRLGLHAVIDGVVALMAGDSSVFAKVTWMQRELQPTDASGKALAKSIDNAVATLLGRRVFVFYSSETLDSRLEVDRFKAVVREWFLKQVPPERFGAIVCAAHTREQLVDAWAIIDQVLAHAPRNDLPAIKNAALEVALDASAAANAQWRCVMLGGGCIADEDLPKLIALIAGSPQLCVVDLTRVKCALLDASIVMHMLAFDHVRFVSIAGTANCDSIRAQVVESSGLARKLIHETEASEDDRHRLFYDFRQRTWEASHEIISARLLS